MSGFYGGPSARFPAPLPLGAGGASVLSFRRALDGQGRGALLHSANVLPFG
jgi:hypothetical protein